MNKITKTDAEWRAQLTSDQYEIARGIVNYDWRQGLNQDEAGLTLSLTLAHRGRCVRRRLGAQVPLTIPTTG